MKFNEIFNEILIETETKIADLSKQTKIDDSLLYDYLKNILPDIENAVKLANYFDCSLSYLMGLDAMPKEHDFSNTYNLSCFIDRYDNILKQNNISHYKLCKETELSYSSHYAWRKGASPAMSSLIIIAQYFYVSIDYLVGRSDKP